ncbi:histidine--tRNA ligase [Acidomonas methanolica]|uniref:Histidine--tRNA ligase n=1 Tax=Acidomonas methanolica NBRC 104435 TaxID=1231351 RepID=A0A023D9B8_ACIMT|nr:histidine--tRNA ligase [Acidomonas methanolica]MBU2653210.1 histidine--tRNA ligase [Acidomonas methanolica]TCS32159.1 histidyl-tRNA synthetase [Acidomonas methanolica]GAJ30406.1 histidyl-tRNA synthetase [Acidomonas methanolica NBRC 104435]GBQ54857.1 histidyl-tRNA synthetase [Acidomonas methanolica]GEK97593.1 histidine--tRNA ligase [Acidomonas methanolica NBRC 104435]
MSQLQPPRGTHDLIGEDARRHAHVVETARRVTASYGYEEWATPVFEDTRVFSRTLGDTSDVVTKEMYTFPDRGGESLTLRPEGTASICRALVTNGLTQSLPRKVFYNGPMFRYERPQKGRYRQFHQIGAELLGSADPLMDAETIAMGYAILRALGLGGDVTLELNTLGDPESRAAWRAALVAYFRERAEALSEESRARLEANPLRILDSKSPQDRALLDDAPALEGFLNEDSRRFWDGVRRGLDAFSVPFVVNPRIVRGLDYYSHTAFEFTTTRLGAQGTVLAGGRYDGLVAEMGGPQTPAIGWAGGIERLALLLDAAPEAPATIVVLPMGDDMTATAIAVTQSLRETGLRAELDLRGSVKKRMERAVKANASHVVLMGDEELARGEAQLRDLRLRAQRAVPLADLPALLAAER